MILYIILTAIILLFVYFEVKTSKIKERIKHTAGPKTLPLIGNAHQLGKTPKEIFQNFFDWWYEFNQDNITLWLGPHLYILVSNVEDIQFILSSNTLIQKSDSYDVLHPWLGQGLLTGTGSKWRAHRKIITPSFHFKILQDFYEIMNRNSNTFLEKLRTVARDENIFDFQDQVHYFTLDVICDTAMGVHINAMGNHGSEIANAFEYMCYNTNMRAYKLLKRNKFIYSFYPDYKDYCKALKILQNFTYKVIEKRIKSGKTEENLKNENHSADLGKSKNAFLDILLSSTIDGRPLTNQEIYEEVSTLLFAGRDTATSAISFTIYLLSRHLAEQQIVYDEQKRIMGHNMKRDATFQELMDMKYLDLVIKETLRLYPSAPIIGRLTEKDYNINGKFIPKNTSLQMFIMTLGYNEKFFPDPYRFKPQRFDVSNRKDGANPFEYVPFSAGPRNCVGQKFAQLEIKTVVSKIVRHFEILPALDKLASKDGLVSTRFGPYRRDKVQHKYEPILTSELTLKAANGIFLRLRERN